MCIDGTAFCNMAEVFLLEKVEPMTAFMVLQHPQLWQAA